MKRIRFITVLLLLAISCTAVSGQEGRSITGAWMGRLNAGAISLRIIFNIRSQGDTLISTMDSPDQGAKNIMLGPVTFRKDSLRIAAPMMFGEYKGIVRNDTLISGTWKQAGQSFTLDLTRLKTAFVLNRPQEPVPPFPYTEEEVTFHNPVDNNDLTGTLTLPQGPGPFRAAVLISGSGAQNRNEELLGHKPFLVLADRLVKSGIAVLRYDDRGMGKSTGNFITSTSYNFAGDAKAAVEFLRKHPKINKEFIGLIGHSEGGLVAPIVASSDRQVAFIVSLSGPGVPGDEIIFRQSADISRASGLSEKQIEHSVTANRKLFSILKKEKNNEEAYNKMNEAYAVILDKQKITGPEKENAMKQLKAGMNPASLTWMRYFVSTDPAYFWKKVKCPVLALNGDKDLQVAADINLPAIEKALRSGGNTKVTTMKMKDLNHLFQVSKTGLPAEYGNIEETFSEDAMRIITGWIKQL